MVKKYSRENIEDDNSKELYPKETKKNKIENSSISLTEFLDRIGGVIDSYVSKGQWVSCEVVSLNQSKGHCYFEIVDTNAGKERIKSQTAVLFSSMYFKVIGKFTQNTGCNITAGMKVLLKLNTSFSSKFGMSFQIVDIDPSYTIGEMEAKANNIRAKMLEHGISNKNKTLKMPNHFTNVAVISPAGAAGLGDFKVEADILEKHSMCNFTYFSATFEGSSTQESILEAFKQVHKTGFENFDCLVFIRGGGSKSSLQFLNEEVIVKCVCRVPIPVITGIGHEKDKVLIDEYSCLSLDTPSKVIEYITNTIVSNYNNLERTIGEIFNLSEQVISNYEQQVVLTSQNNYNLIDNFISNFENNTIRNCDNIRSRTIDIINDYETNIRRQSDYVYNEIEGYVVLFENGINNISNQILSDMDKMVELKNHQIKSLIAEIRELDPTKILNRGYAIIKENNIIVDSIDKLKDLNKITIVLKDGQAEFKINQE
ncbi:exodeoxyribonuclease VII large subunit [Arcobacter sp.]|uniref:exodeoxyribonuclease VII large subunit n=1 Tax=Arcobacter sp. TaxID=1872629 RepID=UPI003D0E9EAA